MITKCSKVENQNIIFDYLSCIQTQKWEKKPIGTSCIIETLLEKKLLIYYLSEHYPISS